MGTRTPGIPRTATGYVYTVSRHDFGHYTDETGRKELHSLHTTRRGANRKARVLLHRIHRDEDENSIAEITEDGVDDRTGLYCGETMLNQDETETGIQRCVVSVSRQVLRSCQHPPVSDDEDQEIAEEEDLLSENEEENWGDNDDDDDEDEEEALRQPPSKRRRGGTESQPIDLSDSQ